MKARIRRQRKTRLPPARGRRPSHQPGRMNTLEKAYAENVLDVRKAAGEIAGYWFEEVNLRLADRTYYRPDFLVMLADGELEFHEVKGHWEDDARVKIKVAASRFPFRFLAVEKRPKKQGGQWVFEEISGR